MRAVLLHSPLVGPSTMSALAEAFDRFRWNTAVIDSTAALQSPSSFLQRTIEQITWPQPLLIGHSGAGAFLPTLAARTHAVAAVFVDAVLPPANAPFRPTPAFVEFIDTLPTVDGHLPKWSEWWPAGTIEELVSDGNARDAVLADMPTVKRSFYDHQLEVPANWSNQPCCYLQLSPAYADECDRAVQWDWPTHRLDGRHLDIIERADVVALQVVELVERLGQDVQPEP